jgi:hypothetical protein
MATEEERKQAVKKAFLEYAKDHELFAVETPGYYARLILPDEHFFFKANVIANMIESGEMVVRGEKWIIKE